MEGQVWRSRVSDAKRLKALEDENAKLKKLLAEAMLDRRYHYSCYADLKTRSDISHVKQGGMHGRTRHQCHDAKKKEGGY
jgi:hypothetical protein